MAGGRYMSAPLFEKLKKKKIPLKTVKMAWNRRLTWVSTQPTGLQPSSIKTFLPKLVFSLKFAFFNAVSATQPSYGSEAAPSNPIIKGFLPTLDSCATTNCEASPTS